MSEAKVHDNRSNQMNPNNDAYWQARGWSTRPADWKSRYNGKGHAQQPNSKDRKNRAS